MVLECEFLGQAFGPLAHICTSGCLSSGPEPFFLEIRCDGSSTWIHDSHMREPVAFLTWPDPALAVRSHLENETAVTRFL